jgi:hypothetical protein
MLLMFQPMQNNTADQAFVVVMLVLSAVLVWLGLKALRASDEAAEQLRQLQRQDRDLQDATMTFSIRAAAALALLERIDPVVGDDGTCAFCDQREHVDDCPGQYIQEVTEHARQRHPSLFVRD